MAPPDQVPGPAPIEPSLEDFGLSENTLKNLPKTWFDFDHYSNNKNRLIVYFWLFHTAIFLVLFHKSISFSVLSLLGFLVFACVIIVPFGFFLMIARPFEQHLFSMFSPNFKRHRNYLDALANYRKAKKEHDKEVNEFQDKIAKQQEAYWRSLSGLRFEKELGKLFTHMGYVVNFTPHTGDGGVDLRLQKDGKITVVQCKAHNKRIPINVARELSASLTDFRADNAIIACFEGVTRPVLEYIKNKPITVLDVRTIVNLHNEHSK